MSIAELVCYEIRCEKCYQSNYLPVEEAGTTFVCKGCGRQTVGPQPTAESMERAVGIDPAYLDPAEYQHQPQDLTKDQIARIAKKRAQAAQAKKKPNYEPEGAPASRLARLAAQLLDALIMAIVGGIGAASVAVLASIGWLQFPKITPNMPAEIVVDQLANNFPFMAIAVLLFFPMGLLMIQWNLIATDGQTIGKKIMFIRIVNDAGHPPGFVQGVVTRNWIKNLLGMVPFFSLVDTLFIFSSSKRCIHDLMAGTYVVSVR